ncbi:hypothetical protein V8G54_018781 [Vigna mungo]|uniref:Uncharacterized protein n=1 Tax=Vigna mungo TaxID=3915 RepID=A0AAQ3N9C8_VIGMU
MAQATDPLSPIELTDKLEAAGPTRQTAAKRNVLSPTVSRAMNNFSFAESNKNKTTCKLWIRKLKKGGRKRVFGMRMERVFVKTEEKWVKIELKPSKTVGNAVKLRAPQQRKC